MSQNNSDAHFSAPPQVVSQLNMQSTQSPQTNNLLNVQNSAENGELLENINEEMHSRDNCSEKNEKKKRKRITNAEMDKELIKIKELICKNFSVEAIKVLLGYSKTKSDSRRYDEYMKKLSTFLLKFSKNENRTIVTADEKIRDFENEFKSEFYEVSYGNSDKETKVAIIKPVSIDQLKSR